MEQIVIDCVPYTLTKILNPANCIQSCQYSIENFLGMDGIEALKRANPFSDPCGYVYMNEYPILIDIEPQTITVSFFTQEIADKYIEQLFDYMLSAYQSVGWEFLRQ